MRTLFRMVMLGVLLMLVFPAVAAAPAVSQGGFWSGYVDGFLGLLNLLASPFIDLGLDVRDIGTWAYQVGYYLGVLTFVGAAGAAAST